MRLCYGTFATVLKLCAMNGKTQLDIHDALLIALDPSDKLQLARDNSQATRWFNCQTNLNSALIRAMEYSKPEEVAENFKEYVMGLIDPNKASLAALAIRAIINDDEGIVSGTIVDMVNNISKADLISSPPSTSPDFFAGVLIYAVSRVQNKEGRTCIPQISDAFLAEIAAEGAENSAELYVQQPKPAQSANNTIYNAILPIYFVLDTSYSMQEENRFSAAFSFLPKLLSAMMKSSSLSDKIRVEVITFDEDASVDLPIGGLNEIEQWIVHYKKNPMIPDGECTHYGKAFKLLRSEIEEGVRQIQGETADGIRYKAYRPVVFFVTDGAPNDDSFDRNMAFAELTDRNFEFRPNMVCVGVGDAKFDDLIAYGAGRYNSPTGAYITRNEKLVIVPRDGVLPSRALTAIIPALVASIVQSFGNTAHVGGSGGVPDLFGEQDDLFEDIDWG